jgi:hypothetical protein
MNRVFSPTPIYGGTTAADPHIWVISQIWDMVCKSYRQGNVYNMFITFSAWNRAFSQLGYMWGCDYTCPPDVRFFYPKVTNLKNLGMSITLSITLSYRHFWDITWINLHICAIKWQTEIYPKSNDYPNNFRFLGKNDARCDFSTDMRVESTAFRPRFARESACEARLYCDAEPDRTG